MAENEPAGRHGLEPSDTERRHAELEYLMRRFGDKVLYLAYSYLRDREWAQDAAQEVFLRVYLALDEFSGQSSYYTWIYRITVNVCRDALRKKNRYICTEPDNLAQYGDTADPEAMAVENITAQEVVHAIYSLPVAYREVLLLHYYHDLSLKEISQVLGITVPAAKVRLLRGRRRLEGLVKDGGGHDQTE
ncbi:MAG: sigma-70 family RNA polymerase sigma factor [Clostridia bacterium]|nr:MAG: sigma-70 family RNA polymerase sigma factor [Clostridia bacterium]